MGKISFGIALILFTIGAIIALALMNGEPKATNDALVNYFTDELTERSVASIGQPIEGFDAYLLMSAFRGIVPEDFDDVDALEGYYSFDGSELVFIQNAEGRSSSAERTIVEDGYQTLYENITARLEVEPNSRGDIDDVLDTLDDAGSAIVNDDTETPPHGGCYIGGCSAQICSDQPDVASDCAYRAEYACYKEAICERQLGGACGWTETEELFACLADAQ